MKISKFVLIILVSLFFSQNATAQIERKKEFKPCEGCNWRDDVTYYYMKPTGKKVYDSGLKRARFSYDTEKEYWSFVFLADPVNKKWKVLLNYRTNEFFIDLRNKEDGYSMNIHPGYQNTKVAPNGNTKVGPFFMVHYDGGSTIIDTNLNTIIPYMAGEKFIQNSTSSFNFADFHTEGMTGVDDWAFMAWPSKRRFKLNGEEISADKSSEEVVMELAGGYTIRKDRNLYSSDGTVIMKMHLNPVKSFEYPSIHRLLLVMDGDYNTYVIDTESKKKISEMDLSNTDPELMLDRFVFMGNYEKKAIGDLVTGKKTSSDYNKIEFTNGKFRIASSGKDFDSELDPLTGSIKNVGFETEEFSFQNVDLITPGVTMADQTICLSHNGKVIRAFRNDYDAVIDFRTYAEDYSTYSQNYIGTNNDPHRMIKLNGGGYALAARNNFSWLKEDLLVIKSMGSKMADWRTTIDSPNSSEYRMDDWKQNTGESTGTAVDFLDLAENTNSTILVSVFLYHQWSATGAQEMRLGLAVRSMVDPYDLKLHDLNLVVEDETHFDGPQDIAEEIKISFIDEKHLVIGYCGVKDEVNYQATVIDVQKIIDGAPLDAQVWQGSLKEMGSYNASFGGLYCEKGTMYYAMSGGTEKTEVNVGKATWNGSSLVVSTNKNIKNYADIGKPHVLTLLNDDMLVLSGASESTITSYSNQPYLVALYKSDMTVYKSNVLLKGDIYYNPQVTDVVSLNPTGTNKKVMILFRGNSNDKGTFYMSEINLK